MFRDFHPNNYNESADSWNAWYKIHHGTILSKILLLRPVHVRKVVHTSSIRNIPLNSTTLFTCTFLDPARFNLHERVARTSIKRIVELFAIVYRTKKDTFTDGEAWRKIAFPTASCPPPWQRRNVDSDVNTIFLLFLLSSLSSKRRRHACGSVISHVEG